MASNVNPSDSLTVKAMDRAIDLAIEGESPYPEHAFVEADSPHARMRSLGRSMTATRSFSHLLMAVSGSSQPRRSPRATEQTLERLA
jgi:hypothetical protein